MKFRNTLNTFFSLLTLLGLHFFHALDARLYNKCSLVQELLKLGVPKKELADWTCIARYESNYNTRAVISNIDYSRDWGIFQINDRFWCDPLDDRVTDNRCEVPCYELLDNITKALNCAQQIKNTPKQFGNWAAWRMRCHRSHFSVAKCFFW